MASQLSALLSSSTFLHSASSAPLSSQIFSDKQHQKQEKTSAAYQMYALIKKSITKTFNATVLTRYWCLFGRVLDATPVRVLKCA